MNNLNKRLSETLDPLMFAGLESIQTQVGDAEQKIDLDKTTIYLTSDPMLKDTSVRTLNRFGLLARYKCIDDETVYMYAEPSCTVPHARAILTDQIKGYGPGTRVRISHIHTTQSSLADATYSVELVDNPYSTFRVPRHQLILDLNAKNLYFCTRSNVRTGDSYETMSVPIARYEYYDAPTDRDIETAWRMLYALYPGTDPYVNNGRSEVILSHEHPSARVHNAAYHTLSKQSLQQAITRPDIRERYLEICNRQQHELEPSF